MKLTRIFNINKVRNEEGFTLVEILAAVFVLAIAMIGVMGVFVNATILMGHVENVSIANNLISERIEVIRNMNYDNVLTVGGSFSSSGMDELPNATGSVALEDAFTDGDIKRVNVTVSWTTDQGRASTITMATYVTRNGISNDT